jgi:hypothetical protein
MTASAVTPYAQQENFETGRSIGRIDREWAVYDPPRNSDAAMLAGYETGWSQQDVIETESHADTDEEARFELELDYEEAMRS